MRGVRVLAGLGEGEADRRRMVDEARKHNISTRPSNPPSKHSSCGKRQFFLASFAQLCVFFAGSSEFELGHEPPFAQVALHLPLALQDSVV